MEDGMVEHIAHIGEMRNTCIIFVGKPRRKTLV